MPMTNATDWIAGFPGLDALDDEARALLARDARPALLPPGTVAFRAGDPCLSYIFVVSGTVRVREVSESGREIVLYRVVAGETCVLTTACLMAREDYAAEGVAEGEVRAVLVPADCFRRLLDRSAAFRDFVFATFARRLNDLVLLVDEVVFGQIDARLAQCLLDRAGRDGVVRLTHHEIAVELGTAREVVSRQLKAFEREGRVRLERGRIEIRDRGALATLARQPG